MKFTEEVVIDRALGHVMQLADNPDNIRHLQPELVSIELLNGPPRQPGAKSRLVYNINGRRMEMIETIVVNNIPEETTSTYETKGLVHTITNRFVELDDNSTKMISDNDLHFTGFMKLMGKVVQGELVKQSKKNIANFKAFAESHPGHGDGPATA